MLIVDRQLKMSEQSKKETRFRVSYPCFLPPYTGGMLSFVPAIQQKAAKTSRIKSLVAICFGDFVSI